MKKESNDMNPPKVKSGNERKISLEGYPRYPTKEDIGSEDKENNYYSIGGDRHDDLEEDYR